MNFEARLTKLLSRYISDKQTINIIVTNVRLEVRKTYRDYMLAGVALGIAIVLFFSFYLG